jgi:hypothetical protein
LTKWWWSINSLKLGEGSGVPRAYRAGARTVSVHVICVKKVKLEKRLSSLWCPRVTSPVTTHAQSPMEDQLDPEILAILRPLQQNQGKDTAQAA